MGGASDNAHDSVAGECLDLSEAIGQSSEKQEFLATLTEGKMSLQKVSLEEFQRQIFQELKELEEQKTKEACELSGRRHKLGKIGKRKGIEQGCYKGWSCQGPRVGFFRGHRQFLLWFLLSLAHDADEAMSGGRERDWWSADMEGEMEKLEVEGGVSGVEGGSVDPKGEAGHWSVWIKTTQEGSEEVKRDENEKQKSQTEVDEAAPRMQTSSNETDGGLKLCEVEERQESRVEVQGPKRRVIRVESEETQDYVRETLAISQEEADEIGFAPSASSEPRGAHCRLDNRCSDKALRYTQIASMVVKPAQSICASCATMQNLVSRANSH